MKTTTETDNGPLYNADVQLWESAAIAYRQRPNGGPRLTIHAGHVGDGFSVLGRFRNDAHAKSVLIEAGFELQSDGTYKAKPETDKATARPLFYQFHQYDIYPQHKVVRRLDTEEDSIKFMTRPPMDHETVEIVAQFMTEDEAKTVVRAVNEHAALVAVAEAAEQLLPYLPTEGVLLDNAALNDGRSNRYDSLSVKLRAALAAVRK